MPSRFNSLAAIFRRLSRWGCVLTVGGWASIGLVDACASATDPQGCLVYRVAAQSDLRFGLPLHRPAVFEGRVASVEGTTLIVETDAHGTGWTAGAWAGVEKYYLLVASGPAEGAVADITGNGTDDLTLPAVPPGLAANAVIRVVPHWTLASLFEDGSGLGGTTSLTGANAPVEVMRVNRQPGINTASTTSYFRYTGAGEPVWRRKGGGATARDHEPLGVGSTFIIRNTTAQPIEWVVHGAVQMALSRTEVVSLQAGLAQDNFVSPVVARPVTLADAELVTSGAIAPTPSLTGAIGDQLLVFDPDATGYNPAAVVAYFYYDGSLGGAASWRRKGAGTASQDDEPVLIPGEVAIVRRAARPAVDTTIWALLPNYLQ